jgi:tetratricopeptide (TPR) repeat protein
MEVVVFQVREIDDSPSERLRQRSVQLRYRVPEKVQYESRNLPLAEIAGLYDFIDSPWERLRQRRFEADSYNLAQIGRKLFDWLDGGERWLSRSIEQKRGLLIIAIEAQGRMGGLPWEILFDDKGFLVTRSIVPIRVVGGCDLGGIVNTVPDRELRALFMATDPIGVYPKLKFEREEAAILKATLDLPMELRVEESGCLDELKSFWRRFRGKFDVFHLNGHANIRNGVPYFITESLEGTRVNSRLEDFDEVFKLHYPPLMFLSGCRTGESSNGGASSSLAADLVAQGAPAVLGWGRSVGDDGAIEAAMLLYQCLAQGGTLAEALALTYGGMIDKGVEDWCLLRLYARFGAWDGLVLPPEDGVWQTSYEASEDFLDPQGLVKVAGRDGFVGRRKYLQQGLRALKSSSNLGIWLYGIGGVGKSAIAARLLDRLSASYQRLVIVGVLDEGKLINLLYEQCLNPTGHQILAVDLPLTQKLTKFLKDGLNEPKQRFIFVLDDFEQNLEPNGDGEQVLKAAVVQPLRALLDGMSGSNLPHRAIVTCRYTVTLATKYKRRLQQFQVERMDEADEAKLSDRLESFSRGSEVDGELREKARKIADGYPRLLEWLNRVLLADEIDREAILAALVGKQQEFLTNILATELLSQQHPGLRVMLERGTIFDLPVPLGVLKSICGEFDGAELDRHVVRARALGLLESGLTDDLVRVPKVLNLTMKQQQQKILAALAVRELYRLWIETAALPTEEQQLEIHRLAILGGDGEIAVKMAQELSDKWVEKSRYGETVIICRSTLDLQVDAKLLSLLARAQRNLGEVTAAKDSCLAALKICPKTEKETYAEIIHNLSIIYYSLGELNQALTLSQQSLELHRAIDNRQGKAASLHQMSIIYYSLGELNQALSLSQEPIELYRAIGNRKGEAASLHVMSMIFYSLGELKQALTFSQESIELDREIGNRQGEAAALHQMSMIYRRLGELNQALILSQQSIELDKAIGDRNGEAASLAQMAAIAEQQGDLARKRELYLQAATIRGSIGDYGGLIITLRNLGMNNDEPDALGYLAQSLWLTLQLSTNLEDAITLIIALFDRIPTGDPLKALLGATAVYFCATRSHPELEQLTADSHKMLDFAARQQGMDTPEEQAQWLVTSRLGEPDYFLAATREWLAGIVGDGWLFDREAFLKENRSAF